MTQKTTHEQQVMERQARRLKYQEEVANSPKMLQCIMTSLYFNGLEFIHFAEEIELNNGLITTTVNNVSVHQLQLLQHVKGSSGAVVIKIDRYARDNKEVQLSYNGVLTNYSWRIGRASSVEREFRVKLEFTLDDSSIRDI